MQGFLSSEEKEAIEAAKESKPKCLRPDEIYITATENGYLFAKKSDGIVRYRTDEQHNAEAKGDEFIEPAPRMQNPTAFR